MKPVRALAAVMAAGALALCAACGSAGTSTATATRTWTTDGGRGLMDLVSADLTVIASDAASGIVTALPQDGTQLAQDATAAIADPMPCDTTDYVTAMKSLTTAGTRLSLGDVTQANTAIFAADTPLRKAISTYNQVMGAPS